MVEVVFVHGVATRSSGPDYAGKIANRDALLRTVAFDGTPCTGASPCGGTMRNPGPGTKNRFLPTPIAKWWSPLA